MGDFITNPVAPVLFTDKAAGPSVNRPPGWTDANTLKAVEANALRDATLDIRAVLRPLVYDDAGGLPVKGAGSTTPRTAAKRAQEAASILDFGAVPDNATDCEPALGQAAAFYAGYAGRVRFPFVQGSTGRYYFEHFISANFAGIELDVDPGVVLETRYDDFMAGMMRGIRFTRPTTFYSREFKQYYVASSARRLDVANPPPAKDMWLDDAGFARARYAPVLCNTAEVSPRGVLWNNSDAWFGSGFSASSAKSFSFAPGAPGYFHAGMRSVLPGDELLASFGAIAGTPLLAALVRTTNGFVGLYASADDAAASMQRVVKTLGVPGTSAPLGPVWQGNHASYAPKNAVWAIRVDGLRRCSLLLNGFLLTSWETSGDIYEAGFGLYVTGGADAVTVQDVVVARGKAPTHGTILSVGIIGDSRSASRYDCWPDFLPHALEHTAGIRPWKVNNLAVGGENSTQQRARLEAVGGAAHDVTVIDIGTNDVQGGVPVATFLANVTAMVDLVQAAGMKCILTNFDLWYTQAQAPAHGQPATNYEKGAPYRSALLRLAAEKGVPLIDAPALSGPILAHYVNPALGLDLTAAGDPAMTDNIHPTTAHNRLRAREVARAICGALMPEVGALAAGALHVGTAGAAPVVLSGAGSPEGARAAPVGSMYLRSDGGAGTSLYAKESGTGATGWVAK